MEQEKSLSTVNDALEVGCYPSGSGDNVAGFELADGGSWSGVVTFEARIRTGTWRAIEAFDIGGRATVGTTRNAVGLYGVRTGGVTAIRARLSTATGGVLIVRALPPAF